MSSIESGIPVRTSVNDTNEGLRIRLSGRPLPEPLPIEAELRKLVFRRLDPEFRANDEPGAG